VEIGIIISTYYAQIVEREIILSIHYYYQREETFFVCKILDKTECKNMHLNSTGKFAAEHKTKCKFVFNSLNIHHIEIRFRQNV